MAVKQPRTRATALSGTQPRTPAEVAGTGALWTPDSIQAQLRTWQRRPLSVAAVPDMLRDAEAMRCALREAAMVSPDTKADLIRRLLTCTQRLVGLPGVEDTEPVWTVISALQVDLHALQLMLLREVDPITAANRVFRALKADHYDSDRELTPEGCEVLGRTGRDELLRRLESKTVVLARRNSAAGAEMLEALWDRIIELVEYESDATHCLALIDRLELEEEVDPGTIARRLLEAGLLDEASCWVTRAMADPLDDQKAELLALQAAAMSHRKATMEVSEA